MAYTVNRVYRCKERTGGGRMEGGGGLVLVVEEWRGGVIEWGGVVGGGCRARGGRMEGGDRMWAGVSRIFWGDWW